MILKTQILSSFSNRSPPLNKEVGKGFAEINPRQAKELGIIQGERIKVLSRRGEIEIKADLSERMERGMIFIPFHFVESAANRLTNPAFDPIAKIPEFKVCAVRIEKVEATSSIVIASEALPAGRQGSNLKDCHACAS
jgi:formate dehydrogenase major subunit